MTTPMPCELYGLMESAVMAGDEYFITEVSSHSLEYDKFAPAVFTLSVFTNITPEHLDFNKNMDNYMSAKAKLFERCRVAVINADDKYASEIYKRSRAEKNVLCSCEGNFCNLSALNICQGGGEGFSMDVRSEMANFNVSIPLEGKFSPTNSLEAIAVSLLCGIAEGELVRVMPTLSGVPGRMERVDIDKRASFSVYIDYAHTPDALENILHSARDIISKNKENTDSSKQGKVILLFGCGGDRDRGKRRQMGSIASKLADFVVVTSDNCRTEDPCSIITDIYKGINKEKEHIIIVERESAIRFAVSIAGEGDVVLLAGKGHEKYDITSKGRAFFDEEQIVKDAVIKKMG